MQKQRHESVLNTSTLSFGYPIIGFICIGGCTIHKNDIDHNEVRQSLMLVTHSHTHKINLVMNKNTYTYTGLDYTHQKNISQLSYNTVIIIIINNSSVTVLKKHTYCLIVL